MIQRNGFKPAIKCQRYPIQAKDIVMIGGKWFRCQAMQSKGTQIRVKFDNKQGYKVFTTKKSVQKYFNFGSFIWN